MSVGRVDDRWLISSDYAHEGHLVSGSLHGIKVVIVGSSEIYLIVVTAGRIVYYSWAQVAIIGEFMAR